MKKKTKYTIILGIASIVLMLAAVCHSVLYNDARLVTPMDYSDYTFRMLDLPMIIAVIIFNLYILYLIVLIMKAAIAQKKEVEASHVTRKLNPKFALFGFFGFFGFLGFWTYSADRMVFPFVFFSFFGFFGFFFEGKMSNTLMDERYQENRMRAEAKANKIALGIITLTLFILGQGRFLGNLEYTLIAIIIIVSFSVALAIFLSEYLLYRYDHDE